MSDEKRHTWYYLHNSKKVHCFDENQQSLCGRWMVLLLNINDVEPLPHKNERCNTCFKKYDPTIDPKNENQ